MSGDAFAQEWGPGWSGREARARLKQWLAQQGWPLAPGPAERPASRLGPEYRHGVPRRHGRPCLEEIEFISRHMRGGPFGGGPFGGHEFAGSGPAGPGGPWRGHRGRGLGRARRGEVRIALLLLLAEEPRNGYQLMQEIEQRSGGRWRPSPGSVYPTLAQLEDEGLVRAGEIEGQRRFEITDAGRANLESRADEPAPWEADEDAENPLTELGPLVIGVGRAAWQVASTGDEQQRARAIALLAEARRGLYRILAEDPDQTA